MKKVNKINTFYNVLNYRGDVAGVYQVVGNKLQCVQNLKYYPSGVLWSTSVGQSVQPYKYGEKELIEISGLDMYDNLARYYEPAIGRANSIDPHCESYYNISPYAWCGNNFVNIVDPTGMDTIDVGYNTKTQTWDILSTQIVEGDDVINVTDAEGNTSSYTYSEGEYGKRVVALNIEDNNIQTFGIIHVSGAENGTFEYVVPAGDGSSVPNSNKRIPDGEYPINAPNIDAKWQQPGLGGNVSERGVRFHYGTDISWSVACYLLFTEYNKDASGKIHFSLENSMQTVRNFNHKLGAHSILYTYRVVENNKVKFRQGATYLKPINYIFIQKTLK